MKPSSACWLLCALLASPSLAAGESAQPDAGPIAAPSESELEQLRASQSIALLKVSSEPTADCTGVGRYHLKLEIITARPGRAIRTAHHSYPLHEQGPAKGSYFVAGLQLAKWAPQKRLCLSGSLAADSSVQLLVPVASKEQGYALLNQLRRDSAN